MFHQYQDPCPQSQLFALFETQKRICQQYIKIASQQLYSQEAETLSTANQLLQTLASKEVVKDLSEWDVFSTRDSVVLEDQSNSFNLSTLSVQTRGKHIQRKSVRGTRPTRELEGSLNDCLAEIQENCGQKTYATVKKIAEEYKKLKLKMFECEKKEKSLRARQRLIEEMQQKNVILSTRIEDIQQTLEKLRSENTALKASNLQLNELLHQKNTEINSQKKIKLFQEIMSHHHHSSTLAKPQPGSSLDLLAGVVRQKEHLITIRFEAVQKLEQKIEGHLFVRDGSCERCCEVLRKMKQSIIAYKRYLQKEGEQFEKLVDKFKLSFLGAQANLRE